MQTPTLTYVNGETPVHRCDARVKIALLLAYSIGIFFADTWWILAAFTVIALTTCLVARLPFGRLNRMLVPAYVFAAVSILCNFAVSPTQAGLLTGAFLAVRIIALTAASFVVCLTSTSSDLLDAFRWFIAPLRHIRVPVDDVAFTLSLALRFIPLVEREFELIRIAQKARGADLPKSFSKQLQIVGSAFALLFINLFRRADTLADAMDARCYGAAPQRTRLPK